MAATQLNIKQAQPAVTITIPKIVFQNAILWVDFSLNIRVASFTFNQGVLQAF